MTSVQGHQNVFICHGSVAGFYHSCFAYGKRASDIC